MQDTKETRNQGAAVCPRCGHIAEIRAEFMRDKKMYDVHVKCPKCFRRGPSYYTRQNPKESGYAGPDCIKALRAWNMGMTYRKGESLEVL